ncbi:MAG: TlyA family RNA methyltransferase [Acidimicrobiales bacterium]
MSPTGSRRRLDQELVERRLVASRNEAQQLVGAGRVLVSGVIAEKPSRLVARAEPVVIVTPRRFVSRGGEKLDAALTGFSVDPADRLCLDAGASTGGFTDCLLQRSARRVVSVDVGHGQLAEQLRTNPRVFAVDRCNVRYADISDLGGDFFEVVVADLSFISLTVVADKLAVDLAKAGADLVMLVKPQFEAGNTEAGRTEVNRGHGVVRDPEIWTECLVRVGNAFEASGAAIMGVMASPLVGPAGNVEFLMHALTATPPGDTPLESLVVGAIEHAPTGPEH